MHTKRPSDRVLWDNDRRSSTATVWPRAPRSNRGERPAECSNAASEHTKASHLKLPSRTHLVGHPQGKNPAAHPSGTNPALHSWPTHPALHPTPIHIAHHSSHTLGVPSATHPTRTRRKHRTCRTRVTCRQHVWAMCSCAPCVQKGVSWMDTSASATVCCHLHWRSCYSNSPSRLPRRMNTLNPSTVRLVSLAACCASCTHNHTPVSMRRCLK